METNLSPYTYQFRAMGSQIQLWLEHPDPDEIEQVFTSVQDYFNEVERALSRFQPASELTLLNGRSGQWVAISPLLWDVISEALALATLTDGLYDPTLLNALEAAGYVASFKALVQSVRTTQPEQRFSGGLWRQVQLDPQRRAIWLPPGARLGLDGVVKGYTAEQAAKRLAYWGPCLVDAGGDLVAGAAPVDSAGWPVAIAAPGIAETEDLLTLSLADAALATSGIDYRRWQLNGRLAHHIIDPRTGQPAATDLLSVSVLLRQAVQAEAVATAVMVLGEEAGFDWLAERDIPALLVSLTGTMHVTPALEAACWDQMVLN